MSERHLDLDGLADLLAAGTPDSDAHLARCATCRARLVELQAALDPVAVSLAALPLPPAPADLDSRLSTALDQLRARATAAAKPARVTRLADRPPQRRAAWLPIAGGVAAAAALVFAVVIVNTGNGAGPGTDTPSALGAEGLARTSNTGLAYGSDGKLLAQELPALLDGTAVNQPLRQNAEGVRTDGATDNAAPQVAGGSTPDPLARLRTTDGLASCLTALNEGATGEALLPLALDYASFEKKPALVVVLPASKAEKVDVFIVGSACAKADAQLLYFARLPDPS